jgi:NAD(P)-dependent dehydrogenase (short-subunit alcohol dehydrogenase family)
MPWNPFALPDQTGRAHVVTGATAGIGYFAAEQLAAAGATVVLAGRSAERLDRARASILRQVPGAQVRAVRMDLASLASVRDAADELGDRGRLDGIFLNGGAMSTGPMTEDGLPLLLATHAIAGVALVERLLLTLSDGTAPDAPVRIVHASTGFVRRFPRDVDDVLARQRGFVRGYTHAKTVTELYAYDLDRRFRADGVAISSIVAHPGIGVDARTPAREGVYAPRTQRRRNPFTPWAQGKDAAAWPALRALTDPDISGGTYLGPVNGRRGVPILLEPLTHTAHPDPVRMARVRTQLLELAAS